MANWVEGSGGLHHYLHAAPDDGGRWLASLLQPDGRWKECEATAGKVGERWLCNVSLTPHDLLGYNRGTRMYSLRGDLASVKVEAEELAAVHAALGRLS